LSDLTKICRKCSLEKKITEFHKDNEKKFGVKNICKKCYSTKKRKSNNKLKKLISSSMYKSLKRNKNNYSWEKIVGYTLDDLKKHLEENFEENMNWDNYGKYWVVEKIIPISFYSNNEIDKCFSLRNIKPEIKEKVLRKKIYDIRKEIKEKHLFDILPLGNVSYLLELQEKEKQ